MTKDQSPSVDASQEQQPPEPDDVAAQLIEQMGDRYALQVAAYIRRLADPQPKDDDSATEDQEQPSDARRGYNVPADSASMRGYISARGAA